MTAPRPAGKREVRLRTREEFGGQGEHGRIFHLRGQHDDGGAISIMPTANRRSVGRAGVRPEPAENPHQIRIVLPPEDPNAPPVRSPPSSRTIARLRAKAEAAARDAVAARALRAQVQPGLKPPAGRACDVDQAGLLLIGPAGAIGISERAVRTLTLLSAGGRHQVSALAVAGGWQDEPALREFLAGLGGRLAAVGLRLDRRKAGWRMAKAQPARPAP